MISNVTLTTKEKLLLEDQKSEEELCVKKYSDYANLASDQELKDLFLANMKQEEQHLQTINQILSGQVPSMGSQSSSGSQSGSSASGSQQSQSQSGSSNSGSTGSGSSNSSSSASGSSFTAAKSQSSDKDLCSDILMTEKFVSGAYNTAIFEFRDTAIRDALNHIQKEEQQHGESVYKYMESKGMYHPK